MKVGGGKWLGRGGEKLPEFCRNEAQVPVALGVTATGGPCYWAPLLLGPPCTHFPTVDKIQDEVELVCSLQRVMQAREERVLDILQEDATLGHDVLLLQENKHSEKKRTTKR